MRINVQNVTRTSDFPSKDPLKRTLNHDVTNIDPIAGVSCSMKDDRRDDATAWTGVLADCELPVIASFEFQGLGFKDERLTN